MSLFIHNLHLAYIIIYNNIESPKEKRTHISLDKNLNTEFYIDDILSHVNSILQIYTGVK